MSEKPWELTQDEFKKLSIEALTQYSANQYLKNEPIEPLKQAQYVAIVVSVAFQKKLLSHLKYLSVEDYEVSRFHNIGLAIPRVEWDEICSELELK